ncbi:hypothetical protein [Streptomyces sp. TLI_171]|uniref:hypothetical protein n=1 Tax=Streptomyces sp. TLI_171 TaxID=1938859 RepID=UPI000C19CC89|nr:hypothetical protein [Streptomyces sp. TLI_171]RKE19950.1 hypothetical protein BX266_3283 [Streptomyces sp. TLI_171]
MAWIDDSIIERAADYLWTAGRVLEQRRFAHLFGAAPDPAGVLAALDAYRTPGGGWAYGLEPDVRGPAAQPLAAGAAARILAEAGALGGERGRELCDWAATWTTQDGGVPAVLPSLRRFPHPPFLPIAEDPPAELLATGQITAPLLAAGVRHPWLTGAESFCRRAIEAIGTTHPYEVITAVGYLDAATDRDWAVEQAARLGEAVRDQHLVLLDPDRPEQVRLAPGYAPGEFHLPHDYAPSPDSLAHSWFTPAELDRGLAHLASRQLPDGGWPINWARWSAATENEARPGVTLAALLTLRAYSR